jgi:hypothetical protein
VRPGGGPARCGGAGPGADEAEARCLLYYSLLIGQHFIAAEHGSLSRPDVVELAIRQLATP